MLVCKSCNKSYIKSINCINCQYRLCKNCIKDIILTYKKLTCINCNNFYDISHFSSKDLAEFIKNNVLMYNKSNNEIINHLILNIFSILIDHDIKLDISELSLNDKDTFNFSIEDQINPALLDKKYSNIINLCNMFMNICKSNKTGFVPFQMDISNYTNEKTKNSLIVSKNDNINLKKEECFNIDKNENRNYKTGLNIIEIYYIFIYLCNIILKNTSDLKKDIKLIKLRYFINILLKPSNYTINDQWIFTFDGS